MARGKRHGDRAIGAPRDASGTEAGSRLDTMLRFDEHDYDPRADYALREEQIDDPLMAVATAELDRMAREDLSPFARGVVVPADLSSVTSRDGSAVLGVYCVGTYLEPVILVDLDAHRAVCAQADCDPAGELAQTVRHEARHAWQDQDGVPFDEDWAEQGA